MMPPQQQTAAGGLAPLQPLAAALRCSPAAAERRPPISRSYYSSFFTPSLASASPFFAAASR